MTEKELKERIAEQEARAEKFQRLHAEGVIEHEVRKAAEDAGAFNADQIIRLLKGKSRLVEAGRKEVVRIVTVGDDGKETHHSPAQAIWHLKQDRDNDNLFKDTMGSKPTLAPPPAQPKLAWNNHEEYLKLRDEHPEVLGLDPLPKRR
jgi:hypothetical protein